MIPKDILDRPVFREVASAFNDWMREYIDEPEKFKASIRSATEFIGSDLAGEQPSYGTEAALTLLQYIDQRHESGEFAEDDDVVTVPVILPQVQDGDVIRIGIRDGDVIHLGTITLS